MKNPKIKKLPKILCLDVETAPLQVYTFGIGEQLIGIDQIITDTHLLSYAAKFVGETKVYYSDQSKVKSVENDKRIVQELRDLMDSADVILGQNSNSFDIKVINSRMIYHGITPPSSYQKLDTLRISRKHFRFTSNKLAFLSKKLCAEHEKSEHKKFPGLSLWVECLAGNKIAWKEMKSYNIKDVLATEDLYLRLRPWDNSLNVNVYSDVEDTVCSCGSTNFQKNGHAYTSSGKFQRFSCADCGAEIRSRENLLSKEKRKSLKK